jgi:glutamyl endopeptidase
VTLCTGFLIGPDTVATAGHCLHRGSGGGSGFFVRTSYEIRPGRNGASIPYACPGGALVRAQRLWTNAGWANAGEESRDYGALHTTCPIGDTTGWFGYSNTEDLSVNELPVDARGYPADKPPGTQWTARNCATGPPAPTFVQCVVSGSTARQLFYANDTSGGQSGAPVYRPGNNPSSGGCAGTCVIAIHAYGLHGGFPHDGRNHGTRIERQVATFLHLVRSGGVIP